MKDPNKIQLKSQPNLPGPVDPDDDLYTFGAKLNQNLEKKGVQGGTAPLTGKLLIESLIKSLKLFIEMIIKSLMKTQNCFLTCSL